MSGETVLIVAFSGRALAQSAQRAGFRPIVVDVFGDLDMRAAASAYATLPDAAMSGFRTQPLVAALDRLAATANKKPIGIVLGSGLEDKVRLVQVLAARYGLLGCSVDALRATKDPAIFFPVLQELGIDHPETVRTIPAKPHGWLSKRIGGSGGRHIRNCTADSRERPRRYFQRRMNGTRISVSAVVGESIAMDMTRQWCAPSPSQPYRYGGAVSVPFGDTAAERKMLLAVDQLARAFDLRGLVSFDFLVNGDTPYLLEINPRAGASLDVVDTNDGSRFHAHIAACREGKLQHWGGQATGGAKAAAILHADRGALTLSDLPWPDWSADRGAPGTYVPQGAPLATVFAGAVTSDEAERLARARLAELETLIYEHAKT